MNGQISKTLSLAYSRTRTDWTLAINILSHEKKTATKTQSKQTYYN